jgi:dolichol kinase
VLAGLLVVASVFVAGFQLTLLFLLAVLCAGFALSTVKALGGSIGVFDEALKQLERGGVMPFHGALAFVAGALFALTFSPDRAFGLGVVMILAFGDGFSTLVGLTGRTRLPWNKKKTWRGLLAFTLAGGIASLAFMSVAGLGYALICGLVESVDAGLDDNILVPVAAVALKIV